MCVPVVTFRSVMKRTPLAETFTVAAANSSASVERATGRLKGNRTAQRTSCRGGVPMPVCETVNPGVNGFIQHNPLPEAISILYLNIDWNRKHQSFFHLAQMYPLFRALGNAPSGPCLWRIRITLGQEAHRQHQKGSILTGNKGHSRGCRLLFTFYIPCKLPPAGIGTAIRPLPPKGRRRSNPFLVPVVVHAHHHSPAQTHQRQYRRQLASVRP